MQGELSATNAGALCGFALAGLDPALLAGWMVGLDLAEGTLVDLFPDHQAAAAECETGAQILYPSRRFLPAKARAFIDHMRAELGRP